MGHNRAGVIRKAKLKRRRLELRKLTRAHDKAEKQASQPTDVAAQSSAEPQK